MESNGGIIGPIQLPHSEHVALWERIILPNDQKDALVNQIIMEFQVRGKLPAGAAPLHGLLLLTGPPGTGKTSLARAAASRAATVLGRGRVKFIEVEPHSLTSSAMGKTQRQFQQLFQETIREHALAGPLIVLLDEAETLAASRARMSLDANPIDAHRATDAVLASLDLLAAEFRELVFIATTNFEVAMDDAFVSRADFVFRVDKPNHAACEAILRDTLGELAKVWPKVGDIPKRPEFKQAVQKAVGLDGRQIRKAVFQACASSKESAMDFNKLTLRQLIATLDSLRREHK